MGEVYRAHDRKLNRDVAIKVLPELSAGDPERLARFTREAQTLAALNHPNVGAIYGVEESAGILGLVMELAELESRSHTEYLPPLHSERILASSSTSAASATRISRSQVRAGSVPFPLSIQGVCPP